MADSQQQIFEQIFERLPLYEAAISDDWEAAQRFFEEKQIDLDVPIGSNLGTALHTAVETNRSHRFVEKLIDRITQSGNREMLRARDKDGHTPLHYAAMFGNTLAARLLINQDPELSQITNTGGWTALKMAAYSGWKETLCYLLEVTKDVVNDAEDGTSPYRGENGAELLTSAIAADFYDVALYLVNKYPDLAIEKNKDKETGLGALATKPNAFKSGSGLGNIWQRIIYMNIPVNREKALQSDRIPNLTKASYASNVSFWRSMLQYLAPQIQQLHDIKVKHIQVEELVKQICSIVMNKVSTHVFYIWTAILPAAKHGSHELVEQCLHHYPALAWYGYPDKGNFILAAIRERQANIYNLVYQMSGLKVYAARVTGFSTNENALHVAAKLAPPHRLNTVTGAALQMQRELKWFKEIENFVHPKLKEDLNKDGMTPRMVFTLEHKELLKEAQQWMKDTSSSATVVAALIITMAFAAIFTVPGGNNDSGKPLFLNDGVFTLFVISDAVALFSSLCSVLMFLSILSSRFAEDDFLYALPKRLMIGLMSLFISLSATIIAFDSAVSLMLTDKKLWTLAFKPGIDSVVNFLACLPMTLFMLLQYPLLVELFGSTYGRDIFYKKNDLLLH